MDKRDIVYAPRAERDLLKLSKKDALSVLDDIEILEHPPWPHNKVKKLKGTDYWEIKSGDFRAIFFQQGREAVVLRVINRRDLEKAIQRIDVKALLKWMRERE